MEALRLLRRERSGEVLLIAPDLLLVEFASLLARKARRREIGAEQAREGFRLMQQSVVRLFETRPLLEPALELALHSQLALGDCVYLALAMQENCPFVTADRRLFHGSKSRHPAIQLLD